MHQFMANMIEPIAVEMHKRGHDVYENYKAGLFEGNKYPKFREGYDATVISYHQFWNKEYNLRRHKNIFFMEHCVSPIKGVYGFPILATGKTLLEESVDYVFAQGPMFMDWLKLNSPDFKGALPTGFSRADTLLNMPDTRNRIIEKHKLEANKPIIVYVPTWDVKTGAGKPGTMKEGWKVLSEMGLSNLLCVAHASDYFARHVYKNDTRVLQNADQYEYIKAADLIIGDISSVLLESTVLNKPIIQLNQFNDLRNFQLFPAWTDNSKSKNFTSLFGYYQLGDIVRIDKQPIKLAIDDALINPNKYQAHRESWKSKSFYNLGHATVACADAMENILGKTK